MNEELIKEQPYRFVIFVSYFFTALVSSLPINTFASINSKVETLFELSVVEVTLNTLIYPISHALFAFPCNWILNKKGIRIGYYFSAALFITGMWLRTFLAIGDPYVCLLGSLISGVGGIFILNTPSRLALNWFKSQSVPLVTFTLVLVNIVSMGMGLAIPGLIIKSGSTAADIINFLRLEAIITTVPFIVLVIVIREKPQYPPSKAALAFTERKSESYRRIMKVLFTNSNYIKLSIVFSLSFGTGTALFSILEQMLTDIGYNNASQLISISGSSGIILGIVANIVYSYYVKKTKKYKRILNIAIFGDIVGVTIWTIGSFYYLDKWWQRVLIGVLFSTNHISLPSISVLFSTELAFPLDQASTAGYMIAACQTFGFIAGLLGASFLDGTPQRSKILFYVAIGLLVVSFVVGLSIKEDLRKLRFEMRNKVGSEGDPDEIQVKNTLLEG